MSEALLLATGAGLSTTIGSLLGISVRRPGDRFLSFTLGLSAGVMLLVSFVELLPSAMEAVGVGPVQAQICFFAGLLTYFLIDFLVPHDYIGQHDHPGGESAHVGQRKDQGLPADRLYRTGVLVAIGLSIHNFPEGMAVFVGGLEDVQVGLAIAVAIAIHNVPEGLAISAPIYAATGNRRKAFLWSFFSGVAEVLGAVLAALILLPFLTEQLLAWVLAFVAGIMVLISIDELIPSAKSFGSEHAPILGVLTGMAMMAASLHFLG
ncbi:MAG: zinc transporter ZupT [Acidimicrobiia bacterium]|nr:zinc transporter ZupT [Acidimicrobiia bacterium]